MDKVRAMMPVLKKHHFWILTAIVVVAAAFGWWKGSGGLDDAHQSARTALEGRFASVRAVSQQINHPNQTFIDAVNEQHGNLQKQVFGAWQTLYDDQQEILQWPERFKEVGQLEPDAEIPIDWRSFFRNYYTKVFQALFETVDPVRIAELPADAAEDAVPEELGIVVWDQGQQDGIREQYAWQTPPSTKAIRFAQEDLWVYEALLTIVKKTNDEAGATANYNAAVKQINDLQIGQSANRPTTRLTFVAGDDAAQATASAPTAAAEGPSLGGSRGASSGPDDATLENGRYVDDQGNRLANAAAGPFSEFKLMPVLIEVVIDQRKIPLLLAECANSPLPVEVRMVRINPEEGGSGGGGGRRGGGGGLGRNLGLGALLPKPAVDPKFQFVGVLSRSRSRRPRRTATGARWRSEAWRAIATTSERRRNGTKSRWSRADANTESPTSRRRRRNGA